MVALDELAKVLSRFDVVEVRVDNVYRKGARINRGRKASQHAHALAADMTTFRLADGRSIPVEGNWGAAIGDKPCGPESELRAPTEHTLFLRDMVCTIARAGIFHHMLTPSSDAAHRDHFHFDIARDSKLRFVR